MKKIKKLLTKIGLFFLYSLLIIVIGFLSALINIGYIITFPVWSVLYIINPEKYLKKIKK